VAPIKKKAAHHRVWLRGWICRTPERGGGRIWVGGLERGLSCWNHPETWVRRKRGENYQTGIHEWTEDQVRSHLEAEPRPNKGGA